MYVGLRSPVCKSVVWRCLIVNQNLGGKSRQVCILAEVDKINVTQLGLADDAAPQQLSHSDIASLSRSKPKLLNVLLLFR